MDFSFSRPVGAQADISELKYIAALHQTCMPDNRENATVSSLDVCRFLKSRMAITVTHDKGIEMVRDLGGGLVSDDIIQTIKDVIIEPAENNESIVKKKGVKAKKRKFSFPARFRKKKDQGSVSVAQDQAEEYSLKDETDKGRIRIPAFFRKEKAGGDAGANQDQPEESNVDAVQDQPEETNVDAGANQDQPEETNVDTRTNQDQPEEKQPEESIEVQHSADQRDESKDVDVQSTNDARSATKESVGHDDAIETPDLEAASDGSGEDVPDDEKLEEYLDLVQLTAVLLMPTLARAGKDWHDARSPEAPVNEPQPPTYEGIAGDIQKMEDMGRTKQEVYEAAEHESLRPKPKTLIPDVLAIMLNSVDTPAGQQYPTLTAELVRDLLLAGGENERAADEATVGKMVEAASSSSGLFDEEALVNALTSDLSDWKVGCEDNETTTFFDVWGFESYREKKKIDDKEKEQETVDLEQKDKEASNDIEAANVDVPPSVSDEDRKEEKSELPPSLPDRSEISQSGDIGVGYMWDLITTSSNIDFAADQFSSSMLTVTIYLFFVCTSLVYAVLIQSMDWCQPKCEESFLCELGNTIITWMIFAITLIVAGYVIVIPLSIGNNPMERAPIPLLIAFFLSLVYNWLPHTAVNNYERNIEEPYNAVDRTIENDRFGYGQWITRAIGILLSCTLVVQFFLSLIGNRHIRASWFLGKWFATSNVKGSWRIKKAATRKINAILEHAHKLHPDISLKKHNGSASTVQTMLNYVLNGEELEDCGGFFWTWKQLLTGTLFDEEGVWIMSRLITIQAIQMLFFIFFTFLIYRFIQRVISEASQAQIDLTDLELKVDLPSWMRDVVVNPDHVKQALYPALVAMMLDMVLLMAVYLPRYSIALCVGWRLFLSCR